MSVIVLIVIVPQHVTVLMYTRKNNGGYFIVSDHGIAVADFSDGLKLI